MPMTRPLIAASLHKAILLSMLLVGLLSIGCVGFFWISAERSRFRTEAASLRSNHLASQKKMIRNQVDRVIDYIDYQRTTTERKLKRSIRCRVEEAIAVADHLHQYYGDRRSEAEIADMIKETIRPIRFNQGRGYYFIYDMAGFNILLPFSPHLEGRNLWNLQDSKGMYTIRRFIRVIRKDGEGFLRWFWYGVSKNGLFWQFFLFENWPSATGQGRRILPPDSGKLKSLGSVAVSANADRSLIPGSKNRTKYGITFCIYNIFRKGQMAPNSKAKSMHLFLQSAGRWGFERCVDRVGRLLRAKS